jgi:hypothetical protein
MVEDFTYIKKSFIVAFNYNQLIGVLTIVINSNNNKDDYVAYSYIGVPPNVFKEFSDNKHKGTYFTKYIKPIYPSRKLNPVEYKYNKPLD